MTDNERIEKLLNRFGQTTSDLPKSDGRHFTYDRDSRSNAEYQVFEFAGQSGHVDILDCLAMHQDYIMHQADVIEKLVTALEVANNRIQYIREMTLCIKDEYRTWATQYAFGCVKTCEQIIDLIDGYPEYEEEA